MSVCCFFPVETKDCPQGEANLQIWQLHSGQLMKALYQKKVESWSVDFFSLLFTFI